MTGGLALGNEKADQLFTPLWASVSPIIDKFGQRAHKFFFSKVQKFYTNNLEYRCRMLRELSQLVRSARVRLADWVLESALTVWGPCSCGKLM